MSHATDLSRSMQEIEQRVADLDPIEDPLVRTRAVALVQSLIELHGAGLECSLALIRRAGAAGDQIIERTAGDTLVASRWLLYGLQTIRGAPLEQTALRGDHCGQRCGMPEHWTIRRII